MLSKVLKITLKSDICLGSGYSFAGIIDTDTCYDVYGLPYIPARRIKGCLKEAAELFDDSKAVEKLFGKSGQGFADKSPLRIGDAYISGYEDLKSVLEEQQYREVLTTERVLDQFTTIKAQTKISEDGVAQDNSLRFIRTVKHYNPLNGDEMVFLATIEITADTAENEMTFCKQLESYAKALRHMGQNRNRGLGNVVCTLQDFTEKNKETAIITEAAGNKNVVLSYCIKAESPLVISQSDSTDTETYISGRAVLGFFASRYLRAGHKADETFEEIFLKKKVRFSPLYPSDKEGLTYVPVPEYMGRLKKAKHLVNTSVNWSKEQGDEWNPGNGNQPKKLRNWYYREKEDGIELREVKKDIIYHNRHQNDDTEALLYGHEAISAGQYFSGTITGPKDLIVQLKGYLENGSITFGKSVSAQYGKCSLISGEIKDEEINICSVKKGTVILVVMESDGIFINRATGAYMNRTEDVAECIMRQFNSKLQLSEYMEIAGGMTTGYYSIWNMKRQTVPTVRAGSCFSYEVLEDTELPQKLYLGENTGEGFGMAKLLIKPNSWKLSKKEENERSSQEQAGLAQIYDAFKVQQDGEVKQLIGKIMLEEAMRKARKIAAEVKSIEWNPTFTGRLTLMLTESEYGNFDDITKVKADLDKEIKSIEDGSKKSKAQSFVDKFYELKADSEFDGQVSEYFKPDDGARIRLECLRQALIVSKYLAKKGEQK